MLLKNNDLLYNARKLRREMTKEERHLWYDFLKNYPVKIYKQRIIGNYIADFYCASAKLVIEIDGSQHYDEKGKMLDASRDAYMKRQGLKVLRFSNLDIKRNFEGVCLLIDKEIKGFSE